MQLIFLYVGPYKVLDKDTGEVVNEGMNVFAHGRSSLKPYKETSGGSSKYGFIPAKYSIPYELLDKVVAVPGLYEAEVVSVARNTKDPTPITKIIDFEFLGELETKLIPPQPPTK